MFTFTTSKTQSQPPPRFQTFNGWTTTIERMRALGAPPARPRKAMSWLRSSRSVQSSPSLPLNCSPFPFLVAPVSSRPAEVVETTVPVYGVGTKDCPGFEPFCCTKVVLVASTASRPCRIRRINTRKELPWTPISKPLPPLPLHPTVPDSKTQPATDGFSHSTTFSHPTASSPHTMTPRNSLEDTFDDGLDVLSLFLRRIAYDVISPSVIHRYLGFMEDGGRVLSLSKTTRSGRRSISPPRRYSSLIGVSLAIMEGRLPKALMVRYY